MTLFELLMETTDFVHVFNTPTDTRVTLCFDSEEGNDGYIKAWVTEKVLNRIVNRVEENYFEECLDVYLEEEDY